jgi:AAA+ superfamily predicted ATPase
MLLINQIIFLSLILFNIAFYAEVSHAHSHEPISIVPLCVPENPEISREEISKTALQRHFQSNEDTHLLSETEIVEMEMIFEHSPQEAQEIVHHLQDPFYFTANEEYRSAFFVGEPGTGKTTMARAIAHKMSQAGWNCKFLSSTQLLGNFRNQTAIRLQQELESAVSSNKPTIIIIDELNRLLENTDSKHHDTDATATALWTFLDRQSNNKNFFFIGTMNRINKLPKPFKDRIISDYIEFEFPTDPTIKSNIVRRNLTTQHTQIDPEVTDEFLCKELEKMGPCSGRNLKKISNAVCRVQKMDTPNTSSPLVIKKAVISKVVNDFIHRRKKIEYDLKEETDEERQERYHNESINLQKKYHEEQMRFQKENQDMQERHFVQQQMIQVTIADSQRGHTFQGGNGANWLSIEGKEKITSIISDEQRKLYENSMIATRVREAKEIADKAAAEKAAADRVIAEKIAAERAKAEKERLRAERNVGKYPWDKDYDWGFD